jgi:hypothetical protein
MLSALPQDGSALGRRSDWAAFFLISADRLARFTPPAGSTLVCFIRQLAFSVRSAMLTITGGDG